MAGLFAFIIVVCLSLAALHMGALREDVATRALEGDARLLLLEKASLRQSEVRSGIESALSHAVGPSLGERARDGGKRLASFGAFEERKLQREGVSSEFWCGFASTQERSGGLAVESLENARALRCKSCASFDDYALDWKGRPLRACSLLVWSNSGGEVASLSRAAAFGKGGPYWNGLQALGGSRGAFGATLYFEGEGLAASAEFTGKGGET